MKIYQNNQACEINDLEWISAPFGKLEKVKGGWSQMVDVGVYNGEQTITGVIAIVIPEWGMMDNGEWDNDAIIEEVQEYLKINPIFEVE